MKAVRITPDYLQSSNFRRSVSVKIAGKCLLQINIQMINPVFDENITQQINPPVKLRLDKSQPINTHYMINGKIEQKITAFCLLF